MTEFLGPTQLEAVIKDIINFWETSKSPDPEKLRILGLIQEYYEARNMTDVDRVLANLTTSVIAKHTEFELGAEIEGP